MKKENVVVVTQHVKNVSTLSDEQSGQLQCALELDDQSTPHASEIMRLAEMMKSSGTTAPKQAQATTSIVRSNQSKNKK